MRGARWIAAAFLVMEGVAQSQTFQPGAVYAAQNGTMAVATADFNADGKPDLAVANAGSSSISIYLGKGDGTFQAGTVVAIPGGCTVANLTAGNFTGGSHTDLLAVCGFQPSVWVLPGLGNGQFGEGIPTVLPLPALTGFGEAFFQGVTVADFNGDGKPDLAIGLVESDFSTAVLDFMAGNGDGTFQAPTTILNSTLVCSLTAADVNGDGKQDLVVVTVSGDDADTDTDTDIDMQVLLGDGKGGFQQFESFNLSGEILFGNALVVDVNGDGIPDILVGGIQENNSDSDAGEGEILVFLGKGDGTFEQGFMASEPGWIFSLLPADLRGRGTTDLVEVVLVNPTGNDAQVEIETRAGNGNGTFQSPAILPLAAGMTAFWSAPIAGDWNGDGLPDLAIVAYTENLYSQDSSIQNITENSNGPATPSEIAAIYQLFPQGDVAVLLNASPLPPLLSVSTAQLQFSYSAGASAPAPQSISVSNANAGALNWTASTTASWLTVSPTSGTAPATVAVSVAPGLAAGTYSGTVEIASTGVGNSPLSVTVTLLVSAAAVGPQITAVVNGASFGPGIESGSWVTILGSDLSNTNPGRTWTASEIVNGNLPTALDGTSVTIDGKPAYVYYISPGQLNVQAPTDSAAGPVQVVVTNNGQISAGFTTQLATYAPAFFAYTGTSYAIASHYPDYALVGTASAPAHPGDVLILWATGFGPTNPPTSAGTVVSGAPAVATAPAITVGSQPVTVEDAVLAPGSAGLYQIAIQLPADAPTGAVALQASVGGVQSPTGTLLYIGGQ